MIGLFDSGYGGLSVLSALQAALPDYDYIYLGDNLHAPYGKRSADEIIKLTAIGVERLFQRDCQLVVLACNTASAVALRPLQQNWLAEHYPDRRLLGIVVPTVEQITGANWQHTKPISTPISADQFTVGVLATSRTVSSNVYPDEIHRRNRSVKVIQQACPELTGLIEQGASRDQMLSAVAKYISLLQQQLSAAELQAILLGCTHYEFIADIIVNQLSPSIKLYRQPDIVAASLAQYLARHSQLAQRTGHASVTYLTSGLPETVSTQASHLTGMSLKFEQA